MKQNSFFILVLLILFSSTLFSILTPMANEITLALGLAGEEQVIYINSMFLIVGAVSSLVWAILGDKFSRKILLIIATLEWSIFTLITTLATDFYSLLIYQISTAVGFGAAIPLTYSLLVDLSDMKERGKKFGLFSAVYVLGNGLGQFLSGFLIEVCPWIVPFIVVSIGGFVCSILLFTVKEPLRGAKDKLYETLDESFLGLSYNIRIKDLKEIWKIKSIFLILCFNFAMFIAIGAISSLLIAMLKNDYQFSSTIATIFLIIIFGSQIPSGPLFGYIGDKSYEKNKKGRMKMVLVCLITGSLFYIVAFSLVFTSTEILMVIIFLLLTISGAFFFGGIDPLTQATLGEINPPQIRSTIYSLNYLLTITIGRSISLLIVGQLFVFFNNQYRPAYIILAIMALLSNLLLIPIFKFLPRDIDKIKSRQKKENEIKQE